MQRIFSKTSLSWKEIVQSLVLGDFDTFRKGVGGLELSDLRLFQPGDSFRDIDQKLSERLGEDYVRVRYPDRELELVFMIDTTASMDFGSVSWSKQKASFMLAKFAAGILKDERMRFSLAVCERDEWQLIMLGKSEQTAMEKIDAYEKGLSAISRARTFNVGDGLSAASEELGGNTIYTIIISDFFSAAHYGQSLRRFVGENHRVFGIALQDAMETDFPVTRFGAFRVADPETGEEAFVCGMKESLSAHRRLFESARCRFEIAALEKGGAQ